MGKEPTEKWEFEASQTPIFFFDGVCNLCNGAVDFMIRHENAEIKIKFSSIQSAFAKKFLEGKKKMAITTMDTAYIWNGAMLLEKSDVAIYLANILPYPYKIIKFGKYLPTNFRNGIYSFIAKRRYSFFGIRNTCRLPTEFEKFRFLE